MKKLTIHLDQDLLDFCKEHDLKISTTCRIALIKHLSSEYGFKAKIIEAEIPVIKTEEVVQNNEVEKQ